MASNQQPAYPPAAQPTARALGASRYEGLSGRAFAGATVALALLLFAVGSALPGQTHAPVAAPLAAGERAGR